MASTRNRLLACCCRAHLCHLVKVAPHALGVVPFDEDLGTALGVNHLQLLELKEVQDLKTLQLGQAHDHV